MGGNTYSYQYDAIGNRQTAASNGLVSTYTANNLNQYTVIANPSDSSNPAYEPGRQHDHQRRLGLRLGRREPPHYLGWIRKPSLFSINCGGKWSSDHLFTF